MPVYGLISFEEAHAIEKSLLRVASRFKQETIRILEIGVHEGRTSRGIRDFLAENKISNVEHWAIDNGKIAKTKPYETVKMVWGDSSETGYLVPTQLHWLFVDGCRCINHVLIDISRYGNRLIPGGEMVVHDTFAEMPLFTDYQEHGPRDRPEFHITGVRLALKEFGLSPLIRQDYKFVEEVKYPSFTDKKGATVFEKVM